MHPEERGRPIPWGCLVLSGLPPLLLLVLLAFLCSSCGEHGSARAREERRRAAGWEHSWTLPYNLQLETHPGEFTTQEEALLREALGLWVFGRAWPFVPGYDDQWTWTGLPWSWRFRVSRGPVYSRWTGEPGWDLDVTDPYAPVAYLEAGSKLELPWAGAVLLHGQVDWTAGNPQVTERQDWARRATWCMGVPIAWGPAVDQWERRVLDAILLGR